MVHSKWVGVVLCTLFRPLSFACLFWKPCKSTFGFVEQTSKQCARPSRFFQSLSEITRTFSNNGNACHHLLIGCTIYDRGEVAASLVSVGSEYKGFHELPTRWSLNQTKWIGEGFLHCSLLVVIQLFESMLFQGQVERKGSKFVY